MPPDDPASEKVVGVFHERILCFVAGTNKNYFTTRSFQRLYKLPITIIVFRQYCKVELQTLSPVKPDY